MNELLFSLHNVLLASEVGNADIEDTEYSCMWSINRFRGGSRPEIDLRSFKRKEWSSCVASWVPCQMLSTVVASLEQGLQREFEREEDEDAANVREVARMRA